jgi:hypothetical protein
MDQDIHRSLRLILESQHFYFNHLLQELQKMATRADLDAAIAQLGTTVSTALTDLQAKIAAGQVQTPEDFSAEIASLQSVLGTVTAADPGAPVATTDTPTA